MIAAVRYDIHPPHALDALVLQRRIILPTASACRSTSLISRYIHTSGDPHDETFTLS